MSDVQTPRTPDWHYGEKLAIKKLDGKVADGKSYAPSLCYSDRIALAHNSYLCAWAHLRWANDSHDEHIRPHTRSVAYARGDDLEGRWHADKNRLPG